MSSLRPSGLILVFWAVLAALIASIAIHAAHFSPWEFVIPTGDPITWIAPTLLAIPPIFLIASRYSSLKLPNQMHWALAIILGLILVAIFAVFSPSAYLGD